MTEIRRVKLDWKKLFAFEQVESAQRDLGVVTPVGERVGGKPAVRLGPKIGVKDGLKIGERLGAKIGDKLGGKAG